MAKNREPVKIVESESETESDEDEEINASSDESDPEPAKTPLSNKPASSAARKGIQPRPSDEEDSGSETESDSDSMPPIRPLASRPMADTSSNPKPKPHATEITTPTSAKRPAENRESDAKRSKKVGIENSEKKPNDDSKKLLFQRLWSEDDEIAVLEGMIDYHRKNKSDPIVDLNAFHDFIKGNLHVDVTRAQLQDKIRRLKKKYENNKSKEKKGKDKTFSKAHEQQSYELSKMIWGSDHVKENGVEEVMGFGNALSKTTKEEANGNVNGKAVSNELTGPLRVNGNGSSVDSRIYSIGMDLFERKKGLEGEQKWMKLYVDELEVYVMQLDVKIAQAKLVLDALKSSD